MDLRPLTDALSVAPQIDAAEMAAVAAAGFRSVIDNRPDGEVGADQASATMAAAAEAEGLRFVYLPYEPGQLTADLVAQFARALDSLPGPVLAYCRSGTRCANLWALSQAGRLGADDIVARGAAAGYDLSDHLPYLRAAEAQH